MWKLILTIWITGGPVTIHETQTNSRVACVAGGETWLKQQRQQRQKHEAVFATYTCIDPWYKVGK